MSLRKLIFILTTLLLMAFTTLFAQTPDLFDLTQRKKEKKELFKKRSLQEIDLQVQSLETAIDPNTYLVGPGDVFWISIWSALESNIMTAVTPEGKLIIQTIGTLMVDGKKLSEVQEMVKKAGAKKYIKSTITANLVQVRSIRVHVTGQVLNPGPYTALAVHRVSDVLEQAGGLTSWAFERAIEVRHRDGSHDWVDLHQYSNYGNIDANIYLRGGDVIFVPAINLSEATVRVEGLVNDPGIYQLVDNETLGDFLLRIDAFSRRSDLTHAYVERKAETNGAIETIPIFPYLKNSNNGHSDLVLQDGDVVMVPQRNENVYVIGAVQNPGPYPYIPNRQVADYVGFAGSNFQAADLEKTKLIRKGSTKEVKGKNLFVKAGDTVFVPQKVKFGVIEGFALLGQVTSILIALKAVGVF